MRAALLLLVVTVLLASCSEYQTVLKKEDVKAKYELAQRLYEEGDYKRSNRLFEQIAPKYVGKPQGERVMFFLSDTYFQTKSYSMAGYQFERFVKSYPQSDKAARASFLGAKCYFLLSPEHTLDQTDTDKALAKLQTFINLYPESEYFKEANQMASELTTKKERKAYSIAKQFNKLGEFDLSFLVPAISAFDNFLTDYPGSVYTEDAMYYRFESATMYAMNSANWLKEARFGEAKKAYDRLIKQYPETKFAKKANNLLGKIEKELQDDVPAKEAK